MARMITNLDLILYNPLYSVELKIYLKKEKTKQF